MPLIKVERRPRAEPPRPPEPPRAKKPAASGVGAVALGLLVGLALLGGLTWALLLRSRGGAGQPAQGQLATAVPAAGGGGQAASEFPTTINVDYPADHVVARVGGVALSMGELEKHVRVARALGQLTGDAIPAWTDADGMRKLQVTILKRVVDMMLLRQAMLRDKVEPMTIPVDQLIADFTSRVGTDQAKLDEALARNGVSGQDLLRWFELSRDSNTYIQVKLLEGQDPSAAQDKEVRDGVTGQWLAEAWQTPGMVTVEFYDPGAMSAPMVGTPGAAPAP